MTGRERHADSLLIRGGSVVDGTGCAAFGADVRVRAGLIVEVGFDLAPDGERELDACGAVVAPGFIDTHTHLDPAVFWDPRCDPMPQHGVTTVVTGNCSLSLAPVAAEQRVELASLFAYIEDMPQSVLARSVPWTWTSWPEYQQTLRQRTFGVNVAALVGHTPLRMFVMGSQMRTPTSARYPVQSSPDRSSTNRHFPVSAAASWVLAIPRGPQLLDSLLDTNPMAGHQGEPSTLHAVLGSPFTLRLVDWRDTNIVFGGRHLRKG